MLVWHEGFIEVNGGRLHYARNGGSLPPLVMLHGFTDGIVNMRRFAEWLTAVREVICVDLRGHGGSSAPPPDFSLPDQADDIAVLIRALGVERPGIYGHSLGAAVAVQVAVRHPDLHLPYLILEDPPIRDVPDHVIDDLLGGLHAWRDSLRTFRALPVEAQIASAQEQNDAWHEDEIAAWRESKLVCDLATFDTPMIVARPDWREAVAKLTLPGLLITGEPDRGAIVTPATADEVKSLWSGVQVVQISGAGHSIRRDQPEAALAAVKAFLREN